MPQRFQLKPQFQQQLLPFAGGPAPVAPAQPIIPPSLMLDHSGTQFIFFWIFFMFAVGMIVWFLFQSQPTNAERKKMEEDLEEARKKADEAKRAFDKAKQDQKSAQDKVDEACRKDPESKECKDAKEELNKANSQVDTHQKTKEEADQKANQLVEVYKKAKSFAWNIGIWVSGLMLAKTSFPLVAAKVGFAGLGGPIAWGAVLALSFYKSYTG